VSYRIKDLKRAGEGPTVARSELVRLHQNSSFHLWTSIANNKIANLSGPAFASLLVTPPPCEAMAVQPDGKLLGIGVADDR
jgi:hypothetical protein